MLTVMMIITQLWDPDYIGALFTGYLVGYTITFWFFSSIVHSYRNLTDRGISLIKKIVLENEILEARILFLNKPVKKLGRPKKSARKKK
jgi:hypothetical protein